MPKFIDELKYNDPELHSAVSAVAELAMAPGALDGKTKLLITIALDALIGAKKGVEALARQAKQAGVTKEEIAEALRLAYFVAGNGVLSIASEAFEEFEEDEEDDDDYEKKKYGQDKAENYEAPEPVTETKADEDFEVQEFLGY